jgi:putative restriction endonuclease
MDFNAFLRDPEWDVPFFKKLPKNDTGNAPGHQGGLVVLKDMRKYFPTLEGNTSQERPTIDRGIKAVLYNGNIEVATVFTRYQYQTWSGTRSRESRLTGQLGPIRNIAVKDDIIIFQRHLYTLDLYRFILIKKDSPLFNSMETAIASRKWGTLLDGNPVSQDDINTFEREEQEQELKPFVPFDNDSRKVETKIIRQARSIVFKNNIRKIYSHRCVVCNSGLETPLGIHEVEASHIIPKKQHGSDDARNGLALCKRHHWAFDQGLFGLNNDFHIIASKSVLSIRPNRPLIDFIDKPITLPVNEKMKPDLFALAWHRDNILIA